MTVEEIKQKVSPVLLKYKVKRASVFGSVAKQTNTEESDIDLLVELTYPMSLLDFVGLKLELEDLLHTPVDLVEYKGIKPIIKESILNSAIPIYE
jgi:predicted nucleotidyltransferase